MGNYGFSKGNLKTKEMKVDGNIVHNTRVLRYEDFDNTSISGANWTTEMPTSSFPLRGRGAAWTSGIDSVPAYAFFGNTVSGAVSIVELVPTGITRGTRADVTVYFTCSGIAAATFIGSGVVWGLDYATWDVYTSGVQVAGYNYTPDGNAIDNVFGNATATAKWTPRTTSGTATNINMSGTVSSATITIPAKSIRPDSFLRMVLYRDTANSADDLDRLIYLIGGKIEYVE